MKENIPEYPELSADIDEGDLLQFRKICLGINFTLDSCKCKTCEDARECQILFERYKRNAVSQMRQAYRIKYIPPQKACVEKQNEKSLKTKKQDKEDAALVHKFLQKFGIQVAKEMLDSLD